MERPVAVTRVVQLVWTLVLLGAAMAVLAAFLDDEILRSFNGAGLSADDTRVAPSFTPVVIVLDVVVTSLVLVLLEFVRGGHNWARHCLAFAFVLLAVSFVAMLTTGPPVAFFPPAIGWLLLDGTLLFFLYRPESAAWAAPRPLDGSGV